VAGIGHFSFLLAFAVPPLREGDVVLFSFSFWPKFPFLPPELRFSPGCFALGLCVLRSFLTLLTWSGPADRFCLLPPFPS